jgi:ssDNA-binding Zn-finger/Zn-ribbon topoisomerase 1
MNNGDLIQYTPGRTLTPVMDLALAQSRLKQFQEFISKYMVDGEDYGEIPGTGVKCDCNKNPDCPHCHGSGFRKKKTLLKPGADKLCELYGLSDSYRVIDRLVDFDRGLFDYEIECTLSRDGMVIATGLGSCSSFEGKYRWRDSKRVCPQCGKESIIKGKKEFGGGWVCLAQKGGCGEKFQEGDGEIEDQEIGRIENDDIATLKNTILKMAKKRAKVDATLSATRSSGVFTQDLGDDEGKKKAAPITQPQRKSESSTPQAPLSATETKEPICPICGSTMRFVPAGESKSSGKPYPAFWSCPSKEHKSSIKDKDWQEQLQASSREPGQEG